MPQSASSSPRPRGGFARHADLLLAVGVMTILALMIVKLPAPVIDGLLALNMAVGTTLLLVTMHLRSPTRIPSMPTILLLATLFRLGLNVATTRLILMDGKAGSIIHAFGHVAVGGNYVVGAVVFLVLVIVQFVVIAKGSERVAEVSARFTLDAMPGKQMSIDADLRNGIITEDEARERRSNMDRESKLYGAMDGAMKFVKGDAIAGIIISLVNIIGGLVIGTVQGDLSAGEAAQKYTLLTIGDGLVSQIPALLISLAAGLVVTRVASEEDEESNLGRDIVGQVGANPKALRMASGVLVGAAATAPITGFPWWPFLALGAVTFLASRRPASNEEDGQDAADAAKRDSATERSFAPHPFVLELHEAFRAALAPADEQRRSAVQSRLKKLREEASAELGFDLPPVALSFTRRIPEGSYGIFVHGGLAARGQTLDGYAYVRCSPEELRKHLPDLPPDDPTVLIPQVLPGSRLPVAALRETLVPRELSARYEVLTREDVVLRHLASALRQNAASFLGIQEVTRLTERLRTTAPSLVQAVTPALYPIQEITTILRLLLKEQAPINDLRRIYETLASINLPAEHRTPELLLDRIRAALKDALSCHYAVARRRLDYYSLSEEIEEHLRAEATGYPLDHDTRNLIRQSVATTIDPKDHPSTWPVLLVPPDIRLATHLLLHPALPDLAILSTQEISLHVEMNFLGQAALSPASDCEPVMK